MPTSRRTDWRPWLWVGVALVAAIVFTAILLRGDKEEGPAGPEPAPRPPPGTSTKASGPDRDEDPAPPIEPAADEARSVPAVGKAPGPAAARVTNALTFIEAGADWRYLDDGTDWGAQWNMPSFNDAAWQAGVAPLGYGDNGLATTVDSGPESRKHTTIYFRKSFDIPRAGNVTSMQLRLVRDDGAVVYLNGMEIVRDNMPDGGVIYETRARKTVGGAAETAFNSFDVPTGTLRDGANVLAVEVHQVSASSSDIRFDLELSGTVVGAAAGR